MASRFGSDARIAWPTTCAPEFQLNDFIHADKDIVGMMLDHPSDSHRPSDAGATSRSSARVTHDRSRFVRQYGKQSRASDTASPRSLRAWESKSRAAQSWSGADLTLFDPNTIRARCRGVRQ